MADQYTACINYILCWTKANRLQLNPDKTECIRIRSSRCQATFPDLNIGRINIHPSASAKSLGVFFDQFLSFDRQLSAVSKSCYLQLHQIRLACKRLDQVTIRTVVQSFVSSRHRHDPNLQISFASRFNFESYCF